ncbi:MAG: protein-disulfide reductase DsbD family protein [Gammaproteobacteria bacterium]
MKRRAKRVSPLWTLLLVLCAPCLGGASTATTPNVRASLLLEHATLWPGASTHALLKLDIRDGWHTYWANPGDSGEATRIDWVLPDGVTVGPMEWPAPSAIPFGGFVNFGYEGVAYHLIPVSLAQGVTPGNDLSFVANATWLVCEEICIPETAQLTVSIPVTPEPVPIHALHDADFAAARAQLPAQALTVSARTEGDGLMLALNTLPALADPYFFPAEWGVVEPSASQSIVTTDDGPVLALTPGASPAASDFAGVLVDRAPGASPRAWQIVAQFAATTAPAAPAMSLAGAVLFALLGGVILNLMPCVFPVLSMKALHLVGDHTNPRAQRVEGLAYTAGVLSFFALLGVILLTLRNSGQAIGWGFQLQSPPVVGVLALLMFAIGLNLLGAFEIGGRFMGVGASLTQKRGAVGAFFTGALAAVVATPCTAPFMGAALGYALTQSAPVAMLVLLSLGVGLALPFLLLALVPALAQRLPRPGRWMETLKQFLAFPMFAAAVWLAWVLALQSGADGVLRLLAAALLLGFAVWLVGRASQTRVALGSGLLVAIGAFVLVVGARSVSVAAESPKTAFSAERVAAARQAGKTVFVNQTAAWCLTCLVNEKNVLATAAVRQAFDQQEVVYLAGDWTARDPAITAFLTEHGRSGVPLYVVYHGDGPANVLPPLLTESIVLDAIAR